jgi:hypothetical protein
MPKVHPATLSIEELLTQCDIKKTRRGGPGGQHRNKVESAIVITHRPTKIIGQAGERRSQHENRDVAIERLRINLAVGFRQPIGPDDSPSDLWRGRVRSRKISVNPKHADFPRLLAEGMDFVMAADFDITVASERLAVSKSQLVKFLKLAPPAFQWLNKNREQRNLSNLK